MSYVGLLFHVAASLFVAPTPALMVLLYFNGGETIPPVQGLLAMAGSAVVYWVVLTYYRERKAWQRAQAEARSAMPERAIAWDDAEAPEYYGGAEAKAVESDGDETPRSFRSIPGPLAASQSASPGEPLSDWACDIKALRALVRSHRVYLINQWHRDIHRNAIGERDFSAWTYEVDRFLLSTNFAARALSRHDAIAIVTAEVEDMIESNRHQPVDRSAEDGKTERGVSFAEWCGETLRRQGWHIYMSADTADRGIDLFAERGDDTVVLNCRLRTAAVDEQVVRQVADGMRHHYLDAGVVVSPSGFTEEARTRARTEGVLLLGQGDLTQLGRLIDVSRDSRKVVDLFNQATG